ncbi:MAG: hypothetical protein JNL57_07855, partial [Bacteroidetes bacterium]|nr:hypothetical protein [Bacteroidota bacterium]
MKTRILLIISLIRVLNSYAQTTDQELENKYYNYRDRLKKYFTQIGEKPGQGLTAAQVFWDRQGTDSFRYINGVLTKVPPREYQGNQRFGDAVVDHGFYLAVLASEYKLMILQNRKGSPEYNALCNELYFAINAIDRLDYNAEKYLNFSSNPSRNGFFIRSDNDEKFMARMHNNPWQPIEKLRSGGARGPSVGFIDSSNGIKAFTPDSWQLRLDRQHQPQDAVSWVGGPGSYGTTYDWGNEMSQDQVYGLLMGFVCVKQWVGGDLVVDPDNNQPLPSKNIVHWVAEITGRIVSHISKTKTGPVPVNDISVEVEKLERAGYGKDIASKPYFGLDTIILTIPDTIPYLRNDSANQTFVPDTMLLYYRTIEKDSSASFPGSHLKSVNIWEEGLNRFKPQNVFSNANYVITNPVRDNNIVTRGHFALPFAYPLRECAKYITGADTFPQPYANPTGNLMIGLATPVGTVTVLASFVLTGRAFNPTDPDFWRDLWNAMNSNGTIRNRTKGKFTSNLQHNLALASRTWSHDEFSSWCYEMGYEYSELFYCMLHGGSPKKTKSFYQNVLKKAQCEGVFNAGMRKDTIKESNYEYCKPFIVDNIFSWPTERENHDSTMYPNQQAGLDYMLLFNLYKMADLEKWKTENYKSVETPVKNCPCVSYPDLLYTSQVRSILETTAPALDTIDNRPYDHATGFYPQLVLADTISNTQPVYDYYKNYNIRIPEYLLHNLTLSGSDSSHKGKLLVNQDLTICHSHVTMKNHSEMEIAVGNNVNFPSQIIVNTGSTVEMRSGSRMVVNDKTTVMVEAGGTLLYKSGAHIILNGPNAVLHIKGTLKIDTGATFTIEGGPAGKGYILWENGGGSPHFGSGTLLAGPGSKLELYQTNKSQTALVCTGGWGLWLPPQLASVKIHDCKIVLKENSRVVSRALSIAMNKVTVNGHFGDHPNPEFDYKLCSGGLHIIDNPATLNDVTVNRCATGITTFAEGGHKPLILKDVKIYNCLKGLVNNGNC